MGIIDTQAVKGIGVRGPRGGACPRARQSRDPGDAGKRVLGRKRVALVDADGNWLAVAVVQASAQGGLNGLGSAQP